MNEPGFLFEIDDVLLADETLDGLHQKIKKFLAICSSNGVQLSAEKFQIGETVNFTGMEISGEGVRPLRSRVAALADFPRPSDKTTLRSFLGLANTFSRWIPDCEQNLK